MEKPPDTEKHTRLCYEVRWNITFLHKEVISFLPSLILMSIEEETRSQHARSVHNLKDLILASTATNVLSLSGIQEK